MCGSGGGWVGVGGTSDCVGIALQNGAEIMLQNGAGNCAAERGRELCCRTGPGNCIRIAVLILMHGFSWIFVYKSQLHIDEKCGITHFPRFRTLIPLSRVRKQKLIPN